MACFSNQLGACILAWPALRYLRSPGCLGSPQNSHRHRPPQGRGGVRFAPSVGTARKDRRSAQIVAESCKIGGPRRAHWLSGARRKSDRNFAQPYVC